MSKAKRARRWLPMFLFALVWLIVGLSAPLVMQFYSRDADVDVSVVAATRHTIRVFDPIAFEPSLGLRLEAGTLGLATPAGQPGQTFSEREALIKSGRADLVLDRGRLVVFQAAPPIDDPLDLAPPSRSPIAIAIAERHYSTLTLRDSVIEIRLPGGTSTEITAARVAIKPAGSGRTSITGRGVWRGQETTFSIESKNRGAETATTIGSAPAGSTVRIAVDSPALAYTFEGALTAGQRPVFEGRSQITTPSLEKLAMAFGGRVELGRGMRDVRMVALTSWGDAGLSFTEVDLTTDNHKATGALSVTAEQKRPLLSGTLDFEAIDLAKYMAAESGGADPLGENRSWWHRMWSALQASLSQSLDMDLRLSADELTFGSVSLGKAAASVLLNNGVLKAHVAEVAFAEGTGSGQISMNFGSSETNVNARGRIDGVDLAAVSRNLPELMHVTGLADIRFDLTTSGSSRADMMKALVGTVMLRSADQNGGQIGIALEKLPSLAAATPASAFTGRSSIREFDAEIAFFNGRAFCRSATIRLPSHVLTATGSVDLFGGDGQFKVRLEAPKPATEPSKTSTPPPLVPKLAQEFEVSGQQLNSWYISPARRDEPGRAGETRPIEAGTRG